MTLGPATRRWLLMIATDMRDHWADCAVTPEAKKRFAIMCEAVNEMQPCSCSWSCGRDQLTTRKPDPNCPTHGTTP